MKVYLRHRPDGWYVICMEPGMIGQALAGPLSLAGARRVCEDNEWVVTGED